MEVTLSAAGTTLLSISKTLDCSGQTLRNQLSHPRRITTTPSAVLRRSSVKFGSKSPLFGLRNSGAAVSDVCCVSSSFASPSGGRGISSGGGGGKVKANPMAAAADDVSPLSSDVIILDVRGMTCGGCSASVQRILENQAKVSSAIVDLTAETATVWPVSEAKVTPNWQKEIGEDLAKQLTTCGFESTIKSI
ncbi:hypothetical protein L1887_24620 [Cichorium endivia]|nr:hypothetical protein L1887_24620 [Cichorium endivia]